MLIKKLWNDVSLAGYHNIKPLTGILDAIPSKFKRLNFATIDEWFETIALRAQNDCNIYLDFIFNKFDFETFSKEIKETVTDMVYILIEHWIYNRIPIEFFVDATNNINTSNMSYIASNLANNMQEMLPQRVKALANFTSLKNFLISYIEDDKIDPELLDLGLYYSKFIVDKLLEEERQERINTDHELEINKLDAEKQLKLIGYGKVENLNIKGAIGVNYDEKTATTELEIDATQLGEGIIIDNLNTDSGKDALSARQGKILNEKIINKFKKIEIDKVLIDWEGQFDLTKANLNKNDLYKMEMNLIAFYTEGLLNNPIIKQELTGIIIHKNNNYIFTGKKLYQFEDNMLKLINSNLSYEIDSDSKKWIFTQNGKTYLIHKNNIFEFNGYDFKYLTSVKYTILGVAILPNKVYIMWGSNNVSIFENGILKLTEIDVQKTIKDYFINAGFEINNITYFILKEDTYNTTKLYKLYKLLNDNKTLQEVISYAKNNLSYFKFQNKNFIIRTDNIYTFDNEELNLYQLGNFSSFDYCFQFNNQTHLGNYSGGFYFYNPETKQFVKTKAYVHGPNVNVFKNSNKNYIFTNHGIYEYQDFVKIFLNQVINTNFLNLYNDQQYIKIYQQDDKIYDFFITVNNLMMKIKAINNKKLLNEIKINNLYQIKGE